MTKFGYTLFCEGFSPQQLIDQAVMAEEAGFDFVAISDHYHPWLPEQEHSAFAWSVLGAIAQATSRVQIATLVTCPIVRYHPAIVAQMAATVGVLSGGRFSLGVGAGERLNEHVVGRGWFAPKTRHQMLKEAIEIIKKLWSGENVSYYGKYFKVEDARIYNLPDGKIELFSAAGGPMAAKLAGEYADGICMTSPEPDLVKAYASSGGNTGNVWGQIVLSWDKDKKAGLKTAYDQFRFSAGGWPVQAELPNPSSFDAATSSVKPEDLAGSIPSGPDASDHLKGIKEFLNAGTTHMSLVYPGSDTKGFMEFWAKELRPKLT